VVHVGVWPLLRLEGFDLDLGHGVRLHADMIAATWPGHLRLAVRAAALAGDERSANPSSLPAAGRPDDRWRTETGRRSTKSPSSSVQAVSHSRWRHVGTHIVSFSSALGTVSDGLVCLFFVGRVLS
jgi:hypothetical protein